MALQTASGVCRVASRILLPTASMAQRLRLFSSRSKQDGVYCSSTHFARVSGARSGSGSSIIGWEDGSQIMRTPCSRPGLGRLQEIDRSGVPQLLGRNGRATWAASSNRALALPACSEGSAVILVVFEEMVLSEPQVLTA